jgi:hypothetical protein
MPKMYDELATCDRPLIEQASETQIHTVLELGSGGGTTPRI